MHVKNLETDLANKLEDRAAARARGDEASVADLFSVIARLRERIRRYEMAQTAQPDNEAHPYLINRVGRAHLTILNPDPQSWDDADLAIGLSRTFRWGGYSQWPLPLPVAQHCLMVLVLVSRILGRKLTRTEYLRELLHDADEALIGGYDAIRPLKPALGEPFRQITQNLLSAAFTRYAVPHWTADEYAVHKHADSLSAASEAIHIAGWARPEIRDMLHIHLDPLTIDPLAEIYDCQPWQPWTPDIAAERFLEALKGQGRAVALYGETTGTPIIWPFSSAMKCEFDCRWCNQEPSTCDGQRRAA